MADEAPAAAAFGPNAWLVDEMYERYRVDPSSVAESWRDLFSGYHPPPIPGPAPEPQPTPAPAAAPPEPPTQAPPEGEPLRGAAARLAARMEASLAVPTATSIRVVPARLLEVNRRVLNGYLGRTRGGRVSYTQLIAFAVVKAVEAVPVMNKAHAPAERGPGLLQPAHVGLGLAVDVPRADGTRTLMVPCIPEADRLDFAAFWSAYEEVIRKVRTGRIGPDDFAGVTMTVTNPGTLGTHQSVPRLMPGQGVIVGVGALDHPAEFRGADPEVLAELGLSKVVALSSTYDHRVIQGAESGLFLARVEELLLGGGGFYDDVFSAMGVPYEAVAWRTDHNPVERDQVAIAKHVQVQSLVNMYRVRGHLIADLDPLAGKPPSTHPELDPATYGLTIWDLERRFFTNGLGGADWRTLGDILGILRDAYCRRVGVEYMHIQAPDQKRWIQTHVEGVDTTLTPEEKRHVLDRLGAAEAFERFLHTKYVGHKRFGLEGAESAIVLIDELLDRAATAGHAEAVMGMAHRGRLDVLVNIVGKSLGQIFREFEGDLDPASTQGSGDVKYHLGASGKFTGRSGLTIPVTLASNPSHLEAVDPVVEGMVRAKLDLHDEADRYVVLPLVVHGDAAFSGQGVVAETLNLSALRGYRVGGTIHLVINNQVGFTTPPTEARSSEYATDVAKMVQAPIFHVNGDDPEACVRVARLAFAFREAFHKDVVIDLVCYRLHGHNEGDDPSYTQPLMYRGIESRRSVRKLYTETLVRRNDLSVAETERTLEAFQDRLQQAFEQTRRSAPPQPPGTGGDGLGSGSGGPPPPTSVDRPVLDRLEATLRRLPDGFALHPKLGQHLERRRELYAEGLVDWALAESLAFGTLLLEGTDVRLTGQDTRRGTFSQRHSAWIDNQTGDSWVPLAHLGEDGAGTGPTAARFSVYDSMLSEYAALGFEYGYAVVRPDALVAWEAQFGDFANAAQVIIDQFLASAEDKWGQASGLVLLLPHGHEGQGPEHSSARVERFLSLCAGDNLRVVHPTTAAQYFHLLRAQVRWPHRAPLVVLAPKSLLRARTAHSPVEELARGGFRPVLGDSRPPSGSEARVLVCAGKVAHDAMAARDRAGADVGVVRVEQLHPWPTGAVAHALAQYPDAAEVVWLQEEPANMGAWPHVACRVDWPPDRRPQRACARPASPSPATGSQTVHGREQESLLEAALAPPGSDAPLGS